MILKLQQHLIRPSADSYKIFNTNPVTYQHTLPVFILLYLFSQYSHWYAVYMSKYAFINVNGHEIWRLLATVLDYSIN